MYAIIENGGHQHKVSPGDTIKVQKIEAENGKEVSLDRVILVADGEHISVGDPFIKNALVKAEMLGNEKAEKALIFKKKPRKGHKKLRGHRQNYTALKITDIVIGG
ncbi:MAG: 50S ribosomal protein L21 [Nitrospiraceae bacterium]|jgi:large subunit ribosomal protein L21|nr:MAG: 50S ribosomal protein L21 [Nitrospiraceae bacterium]